ncbi:MAG: TIGR03619 family F420-dependent LLM class oxidoreductase [Polyangiaceae bacterium]|nr:TIGR03619 family F420-dependent LLM class oxidoreductase [Polyangiaceae bacterium]
MEIGLHLPTSQPGADAGSIASVAAAAERLGFDSVWMFDHLLTPAELASSYPYAKGGAYPLTARDPFFDPVAMLGVLAGSTRRVRLGTNVLVAAYRHPIVLGKALATIEQFAPGRLVIGLGAGWMAEEFAALGVPFEQRGARLEEHVAALRAVWSGAATGFEGERYRWQPAGFLPAPTRPIPLVLGGHGDAAVDRAARLGDGWALATGRGQGSGLTAMASRLEHLRGRLRAHGREGQPFEIVCQHALVFSSDPVASLPFSGPPEAIAASLRALAGRGVTQVDLAVFGEASEIVERAHEFAERVRPLL